MPWCEACSKYLTPSGMTTEGRCPTCGADLGEADRRRREALEEEKTPWHFKLLVVALIVYLGWRFVELFT